MLSDNLPLRRVCVYVAMSVSGDEKFRPAYESRRGSKNGIGNGLLLMMDVETFEDAHYPR